MHLRGCSLLCCIWNTWFGLSRFLNVFALKLSTGFWQFQSPSDWENFANSRSPTQGHFLQGLLIAGNLLSVIEAILLRTWGCLSVSTH